jgi:3-oxoacyl-[acyl-carrier protein] reductase
MGGLEGPEMTQRQAAEKIEDQRAMLGLRRSYVRVLAKEGVTVNAIVPALAVPRCLPPTQSQSRRWFPSVGSARSRKWRTWRNVGRHAYITGQTINVGGGLYMN